MTKKKVVDVTAIKGVNDAVKLGDKIIIVTGNKETAILEGITSTVISVENTVLKVKGLVNNNPIIVNFMQDGRDGTKYVAYSRAHRAKELQNELEYATQEFKKVTDDLNARIEKLTFKSDEAYDDAVFAAKVKAVR